MTLINRVYRHSFSCEIIKRQFDEIIRHEQKRLGRSYYSSCRKVGGSGLLTDCLKQCHVMASLSVHIEQALHSFVSKNENFRF